MNGKRSFLLASVLSIQNSSFTYPACKNCLSRVTDSPNGCKCLRCGFISLESNYRYKLCLRVAEGGRLCMITVFGGCLEPMFGVPADSLQKLLQDSAQGPRAPEEPDPQELLLQAAESYFIGRSFVFGVQIPAGPRAAPSLPLLIAGCISPPTDDPTSHTVLSYYRRLLNSAEPAERTFALPDDSTRSFSVPSPSENTSGCQEDEEEEQQRHVPDFWPKSYGLTPSPLGDSSAGLSLCQLSRNSSRSIERSPRGSRSPLNISTSSRASLEPDTFGVRSARIWKRSGASRMATSDPRTETNKNDCDAPSELPESSAKRTRQERSSGLSSKKRNAAGSLRGEGDTWEDSLFSESLSEFIERVEKEDARPRNFPASGEGLNFVNSPPAGFHDLENRSRSPCANTAPGHGAESHRWRGDRRIHDGETDVAVCSDSNKVSRARMRPPMGSLSRDILMTLPNDPGEDLPGSFQSGNRGIDAKNELSGAAVHHWGMLIREDDLGQPLDIAELGASPSTDGRLTFETDGCNISADLFEASDRGGTPQGGERGDMVGLSRSTPGGPKRAGVTTVTCEDQTREFCPRLQSTPLLKHVLRPERTRIGKKTPKRSFNSESGSVFLGQLSGDSLRRVLLKNTAESALENKSGAPFRSATRNVVHRLHDSGEREALSPPRKMVASPEKNPETPEVGKLPVSRTARTVDVPLDNKENEQAGGRNTSGWGGENFSLTGSPALSPVTRLPFTPAAGAESPGSSCDWSPELFSEKSNTRPQKRFT